MENRSLQVNDRVVVEREHFQQMLDVLSKMGYQLLGPTVRDGAVVYDEIERVDDFPIGWIDEQERGTYRLKRESSETFFSYVVGQHSWKRFLFEPTLRLWEAGRGRNGFDIQAGEDAERRMAFIGVRSCDLQAIGIQDKIFAGGTYVDPHYERRRRDVFILAVNCGRAGGTCFCVSMKTGPKATSGFDLAVTEVLESGKHYFVIEVGTTRGAEVIRQVTHEKAREEEAVAAERMVARACEHMGRTLDTDGIKEMLYRNYEHPRWYNVAERCLTCTNCTLVCPTCFCSTVEDYTDLSGGKSERRRIWDSCFTLDFSYIHGGSVRASVRSRYRQWMTHKLATWIDQFGMLGCVGCGRCITWCPVGIDITEEARVIRETERGHARRSA